MCCAAELQQTDGDRQVFPRPGKPGQIRACSCHSDVKYFTESAPQEGSCPCSCAELWIARWQRLWWGLQSSREPLGVLTRCQRKQICSRPAGGNWWPLVCYPYVLFTQRLEHLFSRCGIKVVIQAFVCREPFSKPRGWLTWALLGMVLSPAVIGITVTIVSYAGYEVGLATPQCHCHITLLTSFFLFIHACTSALRAFMMCMMARDMAERCYII